MLRKIFDYSLSFFEKGKCLHPLHPLAEATDSFFFEAPINTRQAPHIRDSVDLKRWMMLVIFALIPTILVAIWNTGLQKLVYQSFDYRLMQQYLKASSSFDQYVDFVLTDHRYLTILREGSYLFFPVMFLSYAVGGFWETLFACIRKHPIAEGFLVTGMLYPLILPPTTPYWMVALGVSFGVVVGKELFGGTGMNILNPALTCRAFLFYSFPNRLSGNVWVGSQPAEVTQSLTKMNAESHLDKLDGLTQATPLAIFNISEDIKRIHIDTIASNTLNQKVPTHDIFMEKFQQWRQVFEIKENFTQLSKEQIQAFVTSPLENFGLGLSQENYQAAYEFASLQYGLGHLSDTNHFFGNMLGSMGETSVLACLIGAAMLLHSGIASWRTMLSVFLGAFLTALAFQWGSSLGLDGGAWNPAKFALPAYKHLLLGGLAFGIVYMATDPVSSPSTNLGKWIYGFLIGFLVLFIRNVNPAFPEGVMLAILLGNVFAPLIDDYALKQFRRRRRVAKT